LYFRDNLLSFLLFVYQNISLHFRDTSLSFLLFLYRNILVYSRDTSLSLLLFVPEYFFVFLGHFAFFYFIRVPEYISLFLYRNMLVSFFTPLLSSFCCMRCLGWGGGLRFLNQAMIYLNKISTRALFSKCYY
jgi:hypothetical protein